MLTIFIRAVKQYIFKIRINRQISSAFSIAFHYFSFQNCFEVHILQVKQFLLECLDWESNECEYTDFMILTFRFIAFKSVLRCHNSGDNFKVLIL